MKQDDYTMKSFYLLLEIARGKKMSAQRRYVIWSGARWIFGSCLDGDSDIIVAVTTEEFLNVWDATPSPSKREVDAWVGEISGAKKALGITLKLFYEEGRDPLQNALVEIFQAALRCGLDPRELSRREDWQYCCQRWMEK